MTPIEAGASLPGGFTLERKLGGGLVSESWLARAADGSRQVVKLARPKIPQAPALLERESRILARLDHPGITPLLGFEADEPTRLRLPWYPGGTLATLRGAPSERVLRALEAVAAALEHAHARGVVHRDLKTSNVVLDAAGEPRIVDFGVAGLTREGADPLHLEGGGSRGSMGPQQAAGAPPEPADDQFALGVLAYGLLTGAPPFGPAGAGASGEPPELRAVAELPAELKDTIAALLSREPADRPSAEVARTAFREAARRFLEAPPAPTRRERSRVELTPPPRPEPIRARPPEPGQFRASSGLEPAAGRTGPDAGARRRRGPSLAAVGMGGALAVAAVVVFVVLPRWVASRPAPSASGEAPGSAVPSAPASPHAASTPDLGVSAREQAEAVLGRLVPLREQVVACGAERWAAAELAAADRRATVGEERFAALDHAAAAAAWSDAAAALQAILDAAPAALATALADGRAALERGDSAAAAAAFETALALDPDSAAAARGVRRAASLDRVLAHVAAGASHERAGRAPAAAEAYRAALALDPEAAAARRGLARLDARAAEAGFAAVLGEAFDALEAGDHEAARRGFKRAAGFRPDAPQVREGLRRVEAVELERTVAGHRERGETLESDEAWSEALAEYEKALERDPTLAFARSGRTRAADRGELAAALAAHITRPDRLAADEVLREARALLLRAGEVERSGPRHRAQVAELERLLVAWSTPVPVRLVSDGETEVTVYRVGRFDRFTRKDLELRPGRYTVVGSRRGYRDVRLELEVAPGRSPAPLSVRCEETL